MPFLILTREDFDDIVARVAPAGAVFLLNPGIASDADIARLRGAGATVDLLNPAALPAAPSTAPGAAPLWIEGAAGGPRQPDAVPAPSGTGTRADAAPHAWRRVGRRAEAPDAAALPRFRQRRQALAQVPVLDEPAFRPQTGQDGRWRNLLALYQRLESDQLAGVRVQARFGGQARDAVTDAGGYFSFELVPEEALAGGWHTVELSLPEVADADGAPLRASAQAMVPAAGARFGIISDIDDTVLWSNVTSKLNMALLLARSNPHTRQPFKGVAAFYRALRDGHSGQEDNAVFYVSSSPWHLFDPLCEFLRLRRIPLGPLLLRELGVRAMFAMSEHRHHKLDQIELILRYYPGMQFVLIGDSGEQDPEIYAEVVRRHPLAVRVIYIRSVDPAPSRIDALDRLIAQVGASGARGSRAADRRRHAGGGAAQQAGRRARQRPRVGTAVIAHRPPGRFVSVIRAFQGTSAAPPSGLRARCELAHRPTVRTARPQGLQSPDAQPRRAMFSRPVRHVPCRCP